MRQPCTAIFVDGPLGGKVQALQDAVEVYHVPVQPEIKLTDDGDERVTPKAGRYVRAVRPTPRNGPLTYRYVYEGIVP